MQYERSLDFDTNPLFALLHESIYCQVKNSTLPKTLLDKFCCILLFIHTHTHIYIYAHICVIIFLELPNLLIAFNLKGASSRWSAHRIRAKDEGKFDAMKAAKEGRPVLFTGEVYKSSPLCLKIRKNHDSILPFL